LEISILDFDMQREGRRMGGDLKLNKKQKQK
jgi:hypothetical protein